MTALRIIRSNQRTVTYWRAGPRKTICQSLSEALEIGYPIREYTEISYDLTIGKHQCRGVKITSKEIRK